MDATQTPIPKIANHQILVVEDESEIRELIALLLVRQGFRVESCSSASQALDLIHQNRFDLMILDWMLPQMSGIEFLRSLSLERRSLPVLMVTAKSEPSDVIRGLESGADDYVTKPFEPSILVARVKALLRRRELNSLTSLVQDTEWKIGELVLREASHQVTCGGQELHLTPSEYKILLEMLKNQGRVLTRDQLISVVQGDGISVTGRTIDTHVFGLRKKLDRCADWIETVRGVGYRVRMAW